MSPKKVFALCAAFCFFVSSISPALGFDMNVTQGNGSVSQSGNTTTVNTNGNTVLQGNTSIGSGETVNIIGGGNVLLRDTTNSPTSWLGNLLSQGNVVLINSYGIYIAKSASINVASLIASTLDIQNEDFLTGKFAFQKVNGVDTAKVLNDANIKVKDDGYVVFLADQVKNGGTITAYMGSVAFGSGQNITVSFDEGGLVNLVVNQGLAQQMTDSEGKSLPQIVNKGTITADGGRVQMTAKLLETTLKSIVNNSGVIEANHAVNKDGVIEFVADGGINNSGTIRGSQLNESGYTFHSTGTLDVGHGNFDNLDGSIFVSGNISGAYSDVGNIQFAGNVTLTGDTTLQADSGGTNNGEIVMNGSSLTGGNFNLTLDASYAGDGHNDTLDGSISGVNLLTLNSSSGAAETFTSSGGFSVTTLKTNTNALFTLPQSPDAGTSAETPYMIYSDSNLPGGLQYINTNATTLGHYYKLANNINASDTSTWNAGAGFVPIGSNAAPFTGNFNGNGMTVSSLFINRPTTDNIGLFGKITGAANDLGLTAETITGQNNVGGFAGQNGGSIVNAYTAGTVTGSGNNTGGLVGESVSGSIGFSYSSATVSGVNEAGGLVGANLSSSSINISDATGNVTATGNDAGGLVGQNNNSSVLRSFATGVVNGVNNAGGLIGYNLSGATAANAYASGAVTASGANAGGLVGKNNGSTISDSYASGTVSANTNAGGLTGNNITTSSITNDYATGFASSTGDANATAGGLIGSDDGSNTLTNNWWFNAGNTKGVANNAAAAGVTKASALSDFYGIGAGTGGAVYSSAGVPIWDLTGLWATSGSALPTMVWQGMGTGGFIGGDVLNPFQVANVNQLQFMEYDLSGYFKQTANIDASATLNWNYNGSIYQGFTPIGTAVNNFTGNFIGNNYTISGLFINRPATDNVGLFGYAQVSLAGQTVIFSAVFTNVNITGHDNVGALIGQVTGDNTVSGTVLSGSVTGSSQVGGLIGMNDAKVTSSKTAATVTASGSNTGGVVGESDNFIQDSFATGNVNGVNNTGGLVGINLNGLVMNSYATGHVTATGSDTGGLAGQNSNSSINDSYATGQVNGAAQTGGLVGANVSNATVSNSYASGNVTATGTDTGGLAGQNNGSSILNAFATGIVNASNNAGGAVGYNLSSAFIDNVYATGSVTASGTNAGGLVGKNSGSTVNNSYATGTATAATNVAGGLVGDNISSSTVTNSFAVGAATSTGDANATAGGLIGSDDSSNTLTNNWWFNAANTNGVANNGAAAGVTKAGALSDFYGSGAGTGGAIYATGAGVPIWDFTGLWTANSGAYPSLIWQGMEVGTNGFIGGTEAYDLQITNLDQLQFMEYDPSAYFRLSNNIDATATLNWNYNGAIHLGFAPAGTASTPFTGGLDGNGKTIDHLFIDRPATDDVGLLGYSLGASIDSVALTNVNITGKDNVGGLVGNARPNSSIKQGTTISGSSVTGTVTGNNIVGGLAGELVSAHNSYSSIGNSFAAVTVTGVNEVGGLAGVSGDSSVDAVSISSSYATGNVSGSGTDVGGLEGQNNNSSIASSYATGNVSGAANTGGLVGESIASGGGSSSIDSSYATGLVTGTASNTGGLAGENSGGSITNSHATATVHGAAETGGLVGLNLNSTSLINSYAKGHVTATGDDAGGLIGQNSGSTVAKDYASGAVDGVNNAGGLIGYNLTGSSVSDSHAGGNITASGINAGGLIGKNSGSSVNNTYGTGTATAVNNAGGLIGDNISSSHVTNSFSVGVAASSGDANATAGGLIGHDDGFNILTNNWWFNVSNANGVGNNAAAAGVTKAGALSDFYGTGAGTGGAVYSTWDFVTTPVWASFASTYPHLNWENFSPSIDITGHAYSDFGITALGAGISLSLLINGTADGSTTTDGSGAFDFSGIQISATDAVLIYLSSGTVTGNAVTVAQDNHSNITGLNVYGGNLLLKTESGAPLTGTTLSTAKGASSAAGILYSFVGSDLTLNSGTALVVLLNQNFIPGQNLTLQGDGAGLTIQAGATLGAGSNTLTVPGDFLNSGTFSANTSTVIFDRSAGTQTLDTGGSAFYNLTHSGTGTLQLTNHNLTVSNALTNSAGSFDANGLTDTVTSLATLSGGNYLAGAGTQTFNGGLTISGGALTGAGGNINTTDLTLSAGSLTAPLGVFDVSGNWLVSGGTFTPGTNTVTFNGAGTQTLDSGNQGFYNLTNNGTGALQLTNHNLTVNGAFTNNSGTFDTNGLTNTVAGSTSINGGTYLAGAGTQTFNGGLTVAGGVFSGAGGNVSTTDLILSSGTLSAPSGAFDVSGNWLQIGGSFVPGGHSVTFDGLGTQLFNSGGTSFDNIIHSGIGTLQLVAPLTLANGGYAFTNTAGTFDLNGNAWTMTGDNFSNIANLQLQGAETVTGLNLDTAHGTVTYDGSVSYGGLDLGYAYHHLTFDGPGGTWNLGSPLTVAGTLDIAAGTINAGPVTLSVAGNWANTGVFNAGTSSVILDGGNQTISGTTSFYNLQKTSNGNITLKFAPGGEQTVTGLLDLSGTASNLLDIRSTTTGKQSALNLQGKSILSYLDIEDSKGTGLRLDCITDCFDSGDNSNWFIPMQQNINDQVAIQYGAAKDEGNVYSWTYILSNRFTEIYQSGSPYFDNGGADVMFKGWLNASQADVAVQMQDGVKLISSLEPNTVMPSPIDSGWRTQQEINANKALDEYEFQHPLLMVNRGNLK
jgi:hypothetical protein